jgi:hypothetical protein
MKKLSLVSKLTLASALTLGAFAAPTSSRPLPPPTACPENYAPVICSNGQVYSNSCFASAAGATGCVPYGGDI